MADGLRLGVVHPTRNRADLAVDGARSTLAMHAVDVLVVSDNSTDQAQSEEIRAGLDELADDRVRYVRPPELMDVSAHWEWAVGHTLDTQDISHLVLATDRYRLKREAFETAVRLATMQPDVTLTFAYDSVWDHLRPVRVERRPWNGLVFHVRTVSMVRTLSKVVLHIAAPQLWNAITPRQVLEGVRERFGTFFSRFPDMSFAYRFCATEEAVRYYDRSCQFHFAYDRSGGWGLHDGAPSGAARELLGQVASGRSVIVPELASTLFGVAAFEYNEVRSAVGWFPELDRSSYLEQEARHAAVLTDPDARMARYDLLRELGWDGEEPTPGMREDMPGLDSLDAALDSVEHDPCPPTPSIHHLAHLFDEAGHILEARP